MGIQQQISMSVWKSSEHVLALGQLGVRRELGEFSYGKEIGRIGKKKGIREEGRNLK